MKKKSDSQIFWMIFSILIVIAPVEMGVFISSIINSSELDLYSFANNMILIVFSLACSLLSISIQTYKAKKDSKIAAIIAFSGFVAVIIWTIYVFSLTKTIYNNVEIYIFILSAIAVVLGMLGYYVCKKSDKNEGETIKKMHDNCKYIRNKTIKSRFNKKLAPFELEEYDLICDPDEFDKVKESLK